MSSEYASALRALAGGWVSGHERRLRRLVLGLLEDDGLSRTELGRFLTTAVATASCPHEQGSDAGAKRSGSGTDTA